MMHLHHNTDLFLMQHIMISEMFVGQQERLGMTIREKNILKSKTVGMRRTAIKKISPLRIQKTCCMYPISVVLWSHY